MSSSIVPNPEHAARHEFAPTEHLAVEAVVAYVDNELSPMATSRADSHLSLCAKCSEEVVSQVRARSLLRGGAPMSAPPSLLGELSKIPTQEIDMRGVGRSNRRGR
ncbi:zf-HC2 domain-containing protein [Gordonia sp. (in: high G+C Gram-positive bacteria)]|uniref:zf-HC2 domain-containing protein n=1 Tax=Gordonia sp. (in: high G+C Gram-positive bacteria) TaxID=84139 RepID=UPI003F99FD8E